MNWEQLDWAALDRLRSGFLGGATAQGPYWQSPTDLASYDLTFAERIGWKWDAVLGELARRNWRPRARMILDWGCGSGVAGRRAISAFGADNFDALHVWDHSPLARDFAIERARTEFPLVSAAPFADTDQPIGLLVISHVLNELPAETQKALLSLIARAEAVIWVEPGNHVVSRQLIAIRETLTPAFTIVAPCPHQGACGLLADGRERDWCHFFAEPPPGVQNDSDWVRFGQRAGVDLRSQAYSYLVLEKKASDLSTLNPQLSTLSSAARILGRAEHFKGFARILSCEADGVASLELQKRAAPELYKELKKDASYPLYRWTRDERGRITAADKI